MIAETAAQGPTTFLQISDIAATLETEKSRALEEIDRQAKERIARLGDEQRLLLVSAGLEIKEKKDKEFESLKTEFEKYFRKALGVAGLALLAVLALSWVSDWARARFSNGSIGKDDVERLVEKEVAKRMDALRILSPVPQSPAPPVQQPQPYGPTAPGSSCACGTGA